MDKKTQMTNYFNTFRNRLHGGMPFQLRYKSNGLNDPWIAIDGYDVRLKPSNAPHFIEINTYPNEPIDVLKQINYISYAPVLKSYLNEKGLKAFYPDDEKS